VHFVGLFLSSLLFSCFTYSTKEIYLTKKKFVYSPNIWKNYTRGMVLLFC